MPPGALPASASLATPPGPRLEPAPPYLRSNT